MSTRDLFIIPQTIYTVEVTSMLAFSCSTFYLKEMPIPKFENEIQKLLYEQRFYSAKELIENITNRETFYFHIESVAFFVFISKNLIYIRQVSRKLFNREYFVNSKTRNWQIDKGTLFNDVYNFTVKTLN